LYSTKESDGYQWGKTLPEHVCTKKNLKRVQLKEKPREKERARIKKKREIVKN